MISSERLESMFNDLVFWYGEIRIFMSSPGQIVCLAAAHNEINGRANTYVRAIVEAYKKHLVYRIADVTTAEDDRPRLTKELEELNQATAPSMPSKK